MQLDSPSNMVASPGSQPIPPPQPLHARPAEAVSGLECPGYVWAGADIGTGVRPASITVRLREKCPPHRHIQDMLIF